MNRYKCHFCKVQLIIEFVNYKSDIKPKLNIVLQTLLFDIFFTVNNLKLIAFMY